MFTEVTPRKTVTGVPGQKIVTPKGHLRELLGYPAAKRAKDERPVLVYFHWPHNHEKHGERTTAICTRVLEDEQLARWSLFFRGIRVEMEKSDIKLAERLGAGDGPSFAVLGPDLEVIRRIGTPKSSGKLAKTLRAVLAEDPKFEATLSSDIAHQERMLSAAKGLEKKERFKSALWLVEQITKSDTRVDPIYDRAVELRTRLLRRLEQQKAEKKRDAK